MNSTGFLSSSVLALMSMLFLGCVTVSAGEADSPLFPFMQADTRLMGLCTLGQRVVVAPRYRLIGQVEEGIAPYSDGKKWGYLRDGKPLTPAIYDNAWPFVEQRGRVVKDGLAGFVDERGGEIIPPTYEAAWDFHQGYAMVAHDGMRRFITKDGRVALATGHSQVLGLSSGRICFRDRDGWAFMDLTGATVLPGPYEDADRFSEGLARVKIGGRWGFIDPAGKLIVPTTYDLCDSFHEGLAAVTMGDKTGFIDPKGVVRIPLTLVGGVGHFSSGFCMVSSGSGVQFIDRTGAVVKTEDELINADSFRHGYARVTSKKRDGYINAQGKWVADFIVGLPPPEKHSRIAKILTDAELAERRRAAAATPALQVALCDDMLAHAYLDNKLTAAQRGALVKEAHEWLVKAGEAGHPPAQTSLGRLYINGFKNEDITWPVDLPKGITLLTKAAEAGDPDGLAALGDCYSEGTGVTKDLAKALVFYRRAAESGSPQAWFGLAECYVQGAGVTKSYAEAEKWYRKALGTELDEAARDGLKRIGVIP